MIKPQKNPGSNCCHGDSEGLGCPPKRNCNDFGARPLLVPHPIIVAGYYTKCISAWRDLRVLGRACRTRFAPVPVEAIESIPEFDFARCCKAKRVVLGLNPL